MPAGDTARSGSPRRVDVDRDWLWWFVIGGAPVAAVGAVGALASVLALFLGARTPPRPDGPFAPACRP